MESSFCGNDQGPFARFHFSTENLIQTGVDFCRTLLISQAITCPQKNAAFFLNNVQKIYTHYKTHNNDMGSYEIVKNFQIYHEKLKEFTDQNVQVNTREIRKALRKVLRQTAEVFSDNETASSLGSDKAPSEDNLDPEEIAAVIPIDEDPDLAKRIKNAPPKEKSDAKKEVVQVKKKAPPVKKIPPAEIQIKITQKKVIEVPKPPSSPEKLKSAVPAPE